MDKKIYFTKGEVVKLSKIDSPEMIVKNIDKVTFRNPNSDNQHLLLGIRCIWFDKNYVLREEVFNSKDLMKIDEDISV